MATPINVVVFKCRKICQTRNRRNRPLFALQKNKQNFGPSQTFVTVRIATNSARASPNIWLILFQISTKSVHFRWSCSRMRQHRFFLPRRVFLIFAFGRIITILNNSSNNNTEYVSNSTTIRQKVSNPHFSNSGWTLRLKISK